MILGSILAGTGLLGLLVSVGMMSPALRLLTGTRDAREALPPHLSHLLAFALGAAALLAAGTVIVLDPG